MDLNLRSLPSNFVFILLSYIAIKNTGFSWVWWLKFILVILGRLRQEDKEFKTSFCYIVI